MATDCWRLVKATYLVQQTTTQRRQMLRTCRRCGEESRLAGVAACVALQAQCVGAGDLYLGRIGSGKWLNAANISEALGRSED